MSNTDTEQSNARDAKHQGSSARSSQAGEHNSPSSARSNERETPSTARSNSRSAGAERSSTQSARRQPSVQRDRFGTEELATVLSHFDLGVISSMREFPRGSRRAPKLLIRTDTGNYLLKRRARGKDDPYKVAFCHGIQMHLASKQFPLPHLIGTRRDNNSMLQWDGTIYEVFEYIKGTNYDNSLEATHDSGKIMALFHKLLEDYEPEYDPPRGSYHGAKMIINSMPQVKKRLLMAGHDPEGVEALVDFVGNSYVEAAKRIDELGLPNWPLQIIHSDWHPGNMLFRGPRVVAVIDYDAARMEPRIVDTANGALQFSFLGSGEDASRWPAQVHEPRFVEYLKGYESVNVLSKAEVRTIPWLMIEALVAESVIPIAATGNFARMDGYSFLKMIERKARWIQESSDRLISLILGD